MTQPPLTRGSWILAGAFGVLTLLACGAVVSCGLKMEQAEDAPHQAATPIGEAQQIKLALAARLGRNRAWTDRGKWSDYSYGQVNYSVQAASDGSLLQLRADPSPAPQEDRQAAAGRAVGAIVNAFGASAVSVPATEMARAAAAGADHRGAVRASTEFWVADGVIYAAPVRAPQA